MIFFLYVRDFERGDISMCSGWEIFEMLFELNLDGEVGLSFNGSYGFWKLCFVI